MKVIKPFYFDEFKCSAGECKDTCCAGWSITIDKDTLKGYQKVTGELGEKLRRSIVTGQVDQFKLLKNGNCPFLNEEKLCEIVIELGDNHLCDTCKIYPRNQRSYLDVIEQDLTLSCPEVAKIIVGYEEAIDFCFSELEDSEHTFEKVEDIELFNGLVGARGVCVDLMQIEEIPLWQRIYICLSISNKVQQLIKTQETVQISKTVENYKQPEYLIEFIKQLNNIKRNTAMKLSHYNTILPIMMKLKNRNAKFGEFLEETLTYMEHSLEPDFELEFSKTYEEFEQFIGEKKSFENYIVYYLFHYYMSGYKTKELYRHIAVMVEVFALVKLFTMVRWLKNGKQISQEEQVDIFYSYSRVIEHGKDTICELFEEMKIYELENMAYLTALIR